MSRSYSSRLQKENYGGGALISVDNNRAIIITIYYIVVQVFTTCKIFVIHYQA